MTELLAVVASPWSWIVWALLLFGAGPPTVLLLIVRAYPAQHPRRDELVNELAAVPYLKRPLWVAALVPLCLHDGVRARRAESSSGPFPIRSLPAGMTFDEFVELAKFAERSPDYQLRLRLGRSPWLRRRCSLVVTRYDGVKWELQGETDVPRLLWGRPPWWRR